MRSDVTRLLVVALLASASAAGSAAALPIPAPVAPIGTEGPDAVEVRYGFGIFHDGGLGRHVHHRRFGWFNSVRRRYGSRRQVFGHRPF